MARLLNENRIKVRLKSTGQTGTIISTEFDSAVYERLKMPIESTVSSKDFEVGGLLGKVSRFLGTEKLGRRIGAGLAKIVPGGAEHRKVLARVRAGEEKGFLEPGTLRTLETGGVSNIEAAGSALLSTLTGLGIGAGVGALTGKAAFPAVSKFLMPAGAGLKTVAGRSAIFEGVFGAAGATEQGENLTGVAKQAAIGATIGALIPVAFKAAQRGLQRLPAFFNITTGGQKAAFDFQLKNPQLARTAQEAGKSFDDIARDGRRAMKILKDTASKEYSQGAIEIAKKYPKKLFGAERYWLPKTEIDRIFNKAGARFDIGVSGGELRFVKAGRASSILETAERSRIKRVFSSLKDWKDFSAKGSTKLLNFLNKARKYETTLGTRESALVNDVLKSVKAPIYKRFPEIEGLFNNWSAQQQTYDFADEVFKATKAGSPTKQISAINKVAGVFDENKEPLFRIAEQLEKQTGVSLLKELSVAETQAYFPNMIRTVAGVGGAFASLSNPMILLGLPFMTQRSAAAMTRGAGRLLQMAPAIQKTLLPSAITGIEKGRQLSE